MALGIAPFACGLISCTTYDPERTPPHTLEVALTMPNGEEIDVVEYTLSGDALPGPRTGSVDVDRSMALRVRIGDLPLGLGYTLALAANTREGTACAALGTFGITTPLTNPFQLTLTCGGTSYQTDTGGDLALNVIAHNDGTKSCPVITGLSAAPLAVNVGASIALEASLSSPPDMLSWSGGEFDTPTATSTNYHCVVPGSAHPTVTIERAGCTPQTGQVEVLCTD